MTKEKLERLNIVNHMIDRLEFIIYKLENQEVYLRYMYCNEERYHRVEEETSKLLINHYKEELSKLKKEFEES